MIPGMARPKSSPSRTTKTRASKAESTLAKIPLPPGAIAQAVYSTVFASLSKPVQQISEQIPTKDAAAVVGFTEALATLFIAQIARAVADNVNGEAARRETTIEMLNAALDSARERLAPKFKFLMPSKTSSIVLPSLGLLESNLNAIKGIVQ